MKQFWLISSMFLLLISCSKDKEITTDDDKIIEKYLTDNALTFSKTDGVYRYSIVPNPAGNENGNVFSIYYTLKDLETGTTIDSHLLADGNPIRLLHDAGAIFPIGLDLGLSGLREGQTVGIIVPGKLAYTNYPSASVPENAILQFEIEVITRETVANIATQEDADINSYITANDLNNTIANPVDPVVFLGGGVYYKRKSVGNGTSPTIGDSLTINYAGIFLNGSTFDSQSGFKYKYGVGEVVGGLDKGIEQMEQSENALIIIRSEKSYGASVRVIPEAAIGDLITQFVVPAYVAKVPPFSVLVFDVTLQTIH